MAKTKRPKDYTVQFDNRSGVFVQGSFKRALFYVDGITVDTWNYEAETAESAIDKWVAEKRILFNKEKASERLAPNEA